MNQNHRTVGHTADWSANRDWRALVENHNISGDESRDEQS